MAMARRIFPRQRGIFPAWLTAPRATRWGVRSAEHGIGSLPGCRDTPATAKRHPRRNVATDSGVVTIDHSYAVPLVVPTVQLAIGLQRTADRSAISRTRSMTPFTSTCAPDPTPNVQ